MGGTCGTYGEKQNVCRVLVKETKGYRPLEREPRRDSKIKVLLKKYDTRTWAGFIWLSKRTPDWLP
jgi:hypothetical protein